MVIYLGLSSLINVKYYEIQLWSIFCAIISGIPGQGQENGRKVCECDRKAAASWRDILPCRVDFNFGTSRPSGAIMKFMPAVLSLFYGYLKWAGVTKQLQRRTIFCKKTKSKHAWENHPFVQRGLKFWWRFPKQNLEGWYRWPHARTVLAHKSQRNLRRGLGGQYFPRCPSVDAIWGLTWY